MNQHRLSPGPVMSVFFLHAFVNGGLLTRIADLQTHWGVNAAELGLVLMGQPIGAMLMFPLTSILIERYPMAGILQSGLITLVVSIAAIGFVDHALFGLVLLVIYGAGFSLCNIAMNLEADRVEARSPKLIMSRCHGLWSIGLLSASLIGVAFRGLGVAVDWHFASMLPVCGAAMYIIFRSFEPAPPRGLTQPGAGWASRFSVPSRNTLRIVGVMVAAVLIDTGAAAWGIILMRDLFTLSTLVETAILPTYLASAALMRLLSDRLIERFGRVRFAYSAFAVASAGVLILTLAGSAPVAYLGFILMGIGVSPIFPMCISAAAQFTDRPASQNVTATTMTVGLLLLGAAPMMGFVAEAFTIRTSFTLLLLPVVLAVALVPILRPAAKFTAV